MSSPLDEMKVKKRNGSFEIMSFDKILNRLKKLGLEADIHLNYTALAIKVIDQLFDNIETTKIDELAAEECASTSTLNPDYGVLAGRIVVSNHQKNTDPSFVAVVESLYHNYDAQGMLKPLLAEDFYDFVLENGKVLEAMLDHSRDYLIDYFGFKTLERAYLMRKGGKVLERLQHMWLRVAIGIHLDSTKQNEVVLSSVETTYELMSLKYFIHATPTLFNAGTPRPQLSSCFLEAMESDSISGIFSTLNDCAMISKYSGGIGLHIHNIRAKGTHIVGNNGVSSGLLPMLKVFNSTAVYVNQGGRRNGSFAIYLEPWHADIESFLDLKKNHGDEEQRARDLFYALWVPDLFMERVQSNGTWSLFCPHECQGLADVYGKAFSELYTKYETSGKARKVLKARDIWFKILDSQMETGTPYLCYKDASNIKSNQNNLGTIKSSNLCVASETKVLTDAGEFEIYKLENQKIHIWNGEEWSLVTVKKTGTNQPILTVTTDRSFLQCTPYHKFYLHDGTEVAAQELIVGQRLLDYVDPHGTAITDHIVSIIDEGLRDDTFCFTEPKRHMGVFNGILTGQCTEIIEYSDQTETAVCNLASIALPSFVKEDKSFDYDHLHAVSKVVTDNLNKVIDRNFYPTEKCRKSNLRHRPIGIGVQGLADTFVLMDLAFHSEQAAEVNRLIFETIYHAAMEQSNQISIDRGDQIMETRTGDVIRNEFDKEFVQSLGEAEEFNLIGAYSTFIGSPTSKGIFQFDFWPEAVVSDRYNWAELKQSVKTWGLRNSLLVAPMPTASTSQILGFNECFEPFTSNIYTRRTLAGEFVIVNKYLVKELQGLGFWNEKIKNNIIANKGSIQHLEFLSQHIRDKYKTVWEIPMKHVINMAADRGAFICQSQSMNLWQEDPTYNSLTSMHFYSWKKGLKTGIYYLRRKPKHQAQQFTIEVNAPSPSSSTDEICEMCSA